MKRKSVIEKDGYAKIGRQLIFHGQERRLSEAVEFLRRMFERRDMKIFEYKHVGPELHISAVENGWKRYPGRFINLRLYTAGNDLIIVFGRSAWKYVSIFSLLLSLACILIGLIILGILTIIFDVLLVSQMWGFHPEIEEEFIRLMTVKRLE